MSAIVSGFGRFLEASDCSINMEDFGGYRYRIAVDDLAEIPESLAITLGDVIVSVSVSLESTAPFGGDDRGTPFVGGDPNEGGDQTDPLGRQLARQEFNFGATGEPSESRDGRRSGDASTWDSSKLRDRRRAPIPVLPDPAMGGLHRRCSAIGPPGVCTWVGDGA